MIVVRTGRLLCGLIGVALLLTACTAAGDDTSAGMPLIVVPGLGMSALNVEVDQQAETTDFDFLLPGMNPVDVLPTDSALEYSLESGLAADDVDQVPEWLALDVDEAGRVSSKPGITVSPISVGVDFQTECPRYGALADALADSATGTKWTRNDNLFCLPYDYRMPPGANSFIDDLQELVERVGDGTPVALACHSQGCLMAYHAMRTIDPAWIEDNIALLFGFAGQFSGCSDCLRWAFQAGWTWDASDESVSPVDPTWAGELALGLQTSVYGDAVLYEQGSTMYQANDAQSLLDDAGALAMSRATDAYSLSSEEWFIKGEQGLPLVIPARFVYGIGMPTTVGYRYEPSAARQPDCTDPSCAGFMDQMAPVAITADGDGGDSSWMNQAPAAWTRDPGCDMRGLPGVGHMDVLTNDDAIDLLIQSLLGAAAGDVPCVSPA